MHLARFAFSGVILAAALLICSLPRAVRANGTLEVGAAAIEITPPRGMRMCGYFFERLNTGTHDPLWAKSLVFRQGDEQGAIVLCDLIGLSRDVTERARRLASEQTGIPRENILIAATHSHTGPLFYGALREFFHQQAIERQGHDPHEPVDYGAQLAEKLTAVIADAQRQAGPARIAAGTARQDGLSFNRRFHLRDGSVVCNPGKLNPNVIRPAGPIDPEVGLLLIRGSDDETARAVFTVFALHLDTRGGTEYSADYPYYLHQAVAGQLGTECVSIFAAGTCGDINHVDVTTDREQKGGEETQRIGAALAKTVTAALPSLPEIESPRFAVRRAIVEAPLQRYSPEEVAAAQAKIAEVGRRKMPFLEEVEVTKVVDLQRYDQDPWPLEVQAFRLSDEVALVGLPGEVFVEIGLQIKAASPFGTTIVIELANDNPAYIPTRKAFAEGSYETVNSRVQPGAGERLVEAATRLLDELHRD